MDSNTWDDISSKIRQYLYGGLGTGLGEVDPNSIERKLAAITDDQGRRVDYYLDGLGRPFEVLSNQTGTGGSITSYVDTRYCYNEAEPFSPTPTIPQPWLLKLTNSYKSQPQGQQPTVTTLVQNQYSYDETGQRLSNQITSAGGTSRTEQYGYDELNRLKTVNYGDGQTQSYSFDAIGNRLSKSDVGGGINGTEGYTFNAANMLLSRAGNSYTNDADGNTLTGGGRTNTWDSQNRLVQCVNGANTSSFVYGADGLRRQSTVNGTTTDFVLDNSMFVRERNHGTGGNTATYLVGGRGPEYRRDDVSGNVRWYLYDGLGSVPGEVDPDGTITSSRKYKVYGLVRGGVNPGGGSDNH